MLSHLFLTLLTASPIFASTIPKRATIPDNTQPYGVNPIKIKTAVFLGNQTADNSCSHRDLGFTGSIKGKWYAIYGDTIWCEEPNTDPNTDHPVNFPGLVRDAVSLTTNNPLKVHDLNLNSQTPVAHQNQFLPYNSAWGETNTFGFGGTSLCETDATAGEAAFFYLINGNDAGIKGAGVAKVSTAYGIPVVEQRYGAQGFWWNSTLLPRYGDQAAYRDVNSAYIYAYGGPPTTIKGYPGLNMYQTRVLASQAFDLTKYQYWHGRAAGWSATPLTTFNTETAVMYNAGQGQVVYSAYYKTYIYVHTNLTTVLFRTAPSPEGPWTADVEVYNANPPKGSQLYAGVAHPYLDTSGNTLTVSYTKESNIIEVVKVTFV